MSSTLRESMECLRQDYANGNNAGNLGPRNTARLLDVVDALVQRSEPVSSLGSANQRDVVEFGRAIKADELIHAIKAYRTLTGESLIESKDAVERIMQRGRFAI